MHLNYLYLLVLATEYVPNNHKNDHEYAECRQFVIHKCCSHQCNIFNTIASLTSECAQLHVQFIILLYYCIYCILFTLQFFFFFLGTLFLRKPIAIRMYNSFITLYIQFSATLSVTLLIATTFHYLIISEIQLIITLSHRKCNLLIMDHITDTIYNYFTTS